MIESQLLFLSTSPSEMTQRIEFHTHRTIREVTNLNEKIASAHAVVEMSAPSVLDLFELLSRHLAKSLSLKNINEIESLGETQVFSSQDLLTLQQVLHVHKCDLQLKQKNGRWNLNLPRYFLKPPTMSPEALNTVIDTNFLLQYHHQLVQLKSQLDSFRNHFLRTKAYSSASGSEIIRISADILYLLHEHFAATNEITSSKHQALVFALYEFLHTNLISPLLHSDTKSAKRLEKHLESAWIGCCCEVIIFIALEQILNNVNASTRWSIEFGEPDADRTDAIDILLTIDSKRFHIQVKSRSNSILIPDIEVFDSKQLLKSPTDLERMKIDYETVERLQIGLFQLNAQGIVIVVKQSLLNLETASPTAELITLLEQALQKIGILPQVNLNAV